MCPLQTGRPPFPIGTSIQFDCAKRWVGCGRPHPCQLLSEYFSLLHLGFSPALFYLKMNVSGETELAWGRTGLNSEPFSYYHRPPGIFTLHSFSGPSFVSKWRIREQFVVATLFHVSAPKTLLCHVYSGVFAYQKTSQSFSSYCTCLTACNCHSNTGGEKAFTNASPDKSHF